MRKREWKQREEREREGKHERREFSYHNNTDCHNDDNNTTQSLK